MKDIYKEIEACIKTYLNALFNKQYEQVLDLLYGDDLKKYKSTIDTLAKQMEYFGENRGFLRFLQLDNLQELLEMNEKKFVQHILTVTEKEIYTNEVERQKVLDSIKINDIEHAEFLSTVFYSMEMQGFDETMTIDSHIQLIKSDGQWKILFKSGLDTMMDIFQGQINDFYERKSKDRLDLTNEEEYLDKFELVGWKNPHGQIVIEPRFAEAGDFDGDLAPARVMSYWGYINRKGDYVISPQFKTAREFEEDFAAVEIETDEKLQWSYRTYWTFINDQGEIICDLEFDDVQNFTEDGLAAVCKDGKWGYLNTKGEIQIDFNFVHANSFCWDEAEVTIKKKNGELAYLTINSKGEVIE